MFEPSIVLLDVHLPDIDGFAVSAALADLPSPPAIVLISSRPITDLRRRVRRESRHRFPDQGRAVRRCGERPGRVIPSCSRCWTPSPVCCSSPWAWPPSGARGATRSCVLGRRSLGSSRRSPAPSCSCTGRSCCTPRSDTRTGGCAAAPRVHCSWSRWTTAVLPALGVHPGVMLLLGVLTAAAAWSRSARSDVSRRPDASTSAAATAALALALIVPAGGRLILVPTPGCAAERSVLGPRDRRRSAPLRRSSAAHPPTRDRRGDRVVGDHSR